MIDAFGHWPRYRPLLLTHTITGPRLIPPKVKKVPLSRPANCEPQTANSEQRTANRELSPLLPEPTLIAAAITACERVPQLLRTLDRLEACHPPPAGIWVHVDGATPAVLNALRDRIPREQLLTSSERIGPGGGRNRLNRSAPTPWIAHFDDDSYPCQMDFFAQAAEVLARHDSPDLAVVATHFPSHEPPPQSCNPTRAMEFVGCGHLMRKDWFVKCPGYVPRTLAYNFEEVDLCLQLHALGARILRAPALEVWHEHRIAERTHPDIAVATLVNTFLFPMVRYPLILLPLVLLPGLHRCLWLAKRGEPLHLAPVIRELLASGPFLRNYRRPVSARAVLSWLRQRKAIDRSQTD